MKSKLQRLWPWLNRGDPWAVGTRAPLILSLLIGSYVFLRMVGTAMMAKTTDPMYFEVCVRGFGGALATGFVCGFLYPRQALIWSAGFSWPLFLWGVFCLPFALFEGPGLVIWLLAAIVMSAISVLGSLLARRHRHWLTEK